MEKLEAKTIVCSYCEGPHFTAKCPHKAKFAADSATSKNFDASKADVKSDKYVPPALRAKMAAEGQSLIQESQPAFAIRLSNLPPDTVESDIRELCSKFGAITRSYVAKDFRTGEAKGWAFVNFSSSESASKAVAVLNDYRYGNMVLKVQIAQNQ